MTNELMTSRMLTTLAQEPPIPLGTPDPRVPARKSSSHDRLGR
jgi:hypothetical protein